MQYVGEDAEHAEDESDSHFEVVSRQCDADTENEPSNGGSEEPPED